MSGLKKKRKHAYESGGRKTIGGVQRKAGDKRMQVENEEGKKKKSRERQAGNTFLDIICILVDGFYH